MNVKTEQPSDIQQDSIADTDTQEVPTLANGFSGVPNSNDVSLFSTSVFLVDETAFRSSIPKVSHWSIAWSDLMMTMFILFLSMFVYQASHKEFLVSDEIEVIGGDTTAALDITHDNKNTFPFVPIDPARPIMSGGSVKKVEPIYLQDIETDAQFFDEDRQGGLDRIKESFRQAQQNSVLAPPDGALEQAPGSTTPPLSQGQENIDDLLKPNVASRAVEDSYADKIFSLSKDNIAQLGLNNFAAIDLVPDQTMRIILTGDLLFETGRAELSQFSKASLLKIATVIREVPYMINVVGHTDNIPMHSEKYSTNWELSVARASIVTRFLVEEINMDPQQFVVSGYSSFRPIRPNTNARNRAVNRRVEIIISKRLPTPVLATVENLK